MATVALPQLTSAKPEAQLRSVLLASSDPVLRASLRASLVAMRWQVREAGGAAEALAQLERSLPEALVLDLWLPDIEVKEFSRLVQQLFPALDLLRVDGHTLTRDLRSPRRPELLSAIRNAQGNDDAKSSSLLTPTRSSGHGAPASGGQPTPPAEPVSDRLPGMVGESLAMRELGRVIRLVAPRDTTVLIEGPTGAGKELVAAAIHSLSARCDQVMAILNCAAIPETLLEAELFGHTRGAFTGATQSRIGRIEAADGGTLFLDEIGEMPLALQAKMLRFLECGEIQRVGDNAVSYVNVRVIAATHQPLEQRAEEGAFRLDLYHRLAVFPVEIPALRERMDDVPDLAEFFLDRLSQRGVRKQLTPDALEELLSHPWPGNVRELMHVIERATILSADRALIERADIRIRKRPRA